MRRIQFGASNLQPRLLAVAVQGMIELFHAQRHRQRL